MFKRTLIFLVLVFVITGIAYGDIFSLEAYEYMNNFLSARRSDIVEAFKSMKIELVGGDIHYLAYKVIDDEDTTSYLVFHFNGIWCDVVYFYIYAKNLMATTQLSDLHHELVKKIEDKYQSLKYVSHSQLNDSELKNQNAFVEGIDVFYIPTLENYSFYVIVNRIANGLFISGMMDHDFNYNKIQIPEFLPNPLKNKIIKEK